MADCRVILGPEDSLHNGLHGTMLDNPPPGFHYDKKAGRRLILARGSAASVFDEPSLGEFADFGAGSEVVHSAYWPVLNRRGWVVDSGDFVHPVIGGDYCFSREFRFRESFRKRRTPPVQELMERRARIMIAAYAHESCKALLVYTSRELNDMREWLPRWSATDAAAVLAKCRQIFPAVQPISAAACHSKWSSMSPLRVVFCGRHFRAKRGGVAIQTVYNATRMVPDIHFTCIGPIPVEDRERVMKLLPDMVQHNRVTRAEVLEILQQSHVLIHTAVKESVGAVLVEALASGMCVIAAQDGNEQLTEWCGDRGAVLFERAGATESEEEALFTQALLYLAESREAARQRGLHNWGQATEGALSLRARDAVLTDAYEAADAAQGHALNAADLCTHSDVRPLDLDAARLSEIRRDFFRSAGVSGQCVNVNIEI